MSGVDVAAFRRWFLEREGTMEHIVGDRDDPVGRAVHNGVVSWDAEAGTLVMRRPLARCGTWATETVRVELPLDALVDLEGWAEDGWDMTGRDISFEEAAARALSIALEEAVVCIRSPDTHVIRLTETGFREYPE